MKCLTNFSSIKNFDEIVKKINENQEIYLKSKNEELGKINLENSKKDELLKTNDIKIQNLSNYIQ